MKHGVRNLLAGFLIGIGCVLPGVSGGVMAVSFGIYRPMLDSLLTFFHDTRSKLRFLLPLAVGGALGMLLGAQSLSVLMVRYEGLMLVLFTGFILGGLPGMVQEAKQGARFRMRWLLSLALGVALALPLMVLGGQEASIVSFSPIQALATGLLEGVGTVVPGISTSFILIRLGWYQAYLRVLSSLALPELIFIALGFIASAFLCMKAVKWLFDHAAGHAYFAVMGFLLVSVALVFPGFHAGRMLWAELALLIAGMVISHWFSNLAKE